MNIKYEKVGWEEGTFDRIIFDLNSKNRYTTKFEVLKWVEEVGGRTFETYADIIIHLDERDTLAFILRFGGRLVSKSVV